MLVYDTVCSGTLEHHRWGWKSQSAHPPTQQPTPKKTQKNTRSGPLLVCTHEDKQKRKERADFPFHGKNEDGVLTQDTRDEKKKK